MAGPLTRTVTRPTSFGPLPSGPATSQPIAQRPTGVAQWFPPTAPPPPPPPQNTAPQPLYQPPLTTHEQAEALRKAAIGAGILITPKPTGGIPIGESKAKLAIGSLAYNLTGAGVHGEHLTYSRWFLAGWFVLPYPFGTQDPRVFGFEKDYPPAKLVDTLGEKAKHTAFGDPRDEFFATLKDRETFWQFYHQTEQRFGATDASQLQDRIVTLRAAGGNFKNPASVAGELAALGDLIRHQGERNAARRRTEIRDTLISLLPHVNPKDP
jgi:hypothetical protein